MNNGTKAILLFLLNKRYIGGKHFPEEKLVVSRTKYLQKEEQKECASDMYDLVKRGYMLRAKKRTGKGSEWHISLNPSKLQEVYEMII